MTRLASLLIVYVLFVACSSDSPLDEYLVREVNIAGKPRGYRVFVPKNRDPNVKLPVMLYLHGSGTRGSDNREQAWAFESAVSPLKNKVSFIVVLPQCREDLAWISDEMSKYALAALDESVKEFNADTGRIYLAGFSLGAHGVWKMAASNPGKFAALMPVAGRVIPDESASEPDSPYSAVAKSIGETPVWVFHGAKDDAVPVDFARKIVKALEANGSKNVKYTEYIDGDHLIFGRAFAEPGFFEWLSEQRLAAK